MVIYYNTNTREIKRTEDSTMTPILPANMTFDEKKAYYTSIGEDFVTIPYEMGSYIFNYYLCFDVNNNFIGLQPKASE